MYWKKIWLNIIWGIILIFVMSIKTEIMADDLNLSYCIVGQGNYMECPDSLEMKVGETYNIKLSNFYADYSVESSNESVVEVIKAPNSIIATLKVVGPGQSTITVTPQKIISNIKSDYKTVALNVSAIMWVDESNIEFDNYCTKKQMNTKYIRTSFDISSVIVTNKEVVSASFSKNTVTLKPLSPGETTVELNDAKNNKATINVKVIPLKPKFWSEEYVGMINSIKAATINLIIDSDDIKTVTSSNPSLGTIRETNSYSTNHHFEFKSTKIGTTTITATDIYDQTTSCTIIIKSQKAFMASPADQTIVVGNTSSIYLTDAIGDVNYSINNSNIISISTNNNQYIVEGQNPGNVTITFTDASGQTSVAKVTVNPKSAAPSILINDVIIEKGKSQSINVIYDSSIYYLDIISWESSNDKIVSVDNDGKIYAKKAGEAIITCTLSNNSKSSCDVKVYGYLDSISNEIKLTEGFSEKIKCTYNKGAEKEKITWKSSNKKIATVSKDGTVKAKKPGKCVITAQTKDGNKYSCKVIVQTNKTTFDSDSTVSINGYGGINIYGDKAYYKNSNLYVVFELYNNRIFYATHFNNIKIVITDTKHNKKYKKTFKNIPISLSSFSSKKITLNFGKKKLDLKNTEITSVGYSYSFSY